MIMLGCQSVFLGLGLIRLDQFHEILNRMALAIASLASNVVLGKYRLVLFFATYQLSSRLLYR